MDKYDVVVIGGGSAGICAATQAARAGASTLLIEKNASLGGTTTNGAVSYPGLFHAWCKQVIAGVGWEIVTKSVALSGGTLPDFSVEPKAHHLRQVRIDIPIYTSLCDEVLSEARVHILFHTMVASVSEGNDPTSKKITICTKTGLQEIATKVIIDCTGDANIAALAGYEMLSSKDKQPGTYSCKMSGYDMSALDIKAINKNFEKWVEEGKGVFIDASWNVDQPNIAGWLHSGGMNANHIPNIDAFTSQGKSIAELEGRASVLRLFRFLKEQPGLENIKIDFLGAECGIRETRRIVGKKIITSEDYVSGKVWEDSLSHSFYPLDVHTLNKSGLNLTQMKKGIVPTVPLGALLPKGSTNFLVAGRCVSSDQLANGALRVQASSMGMGQAAGATAALCVLQCKEIESVDLNEIKNLLLAHKGVVPKQK